MTTLLLFLILLAAVIPLTKVSVDKISAEAATIRYELLRKIVHDAISHVEQVTNMEENNVEPEVKKAKALDIATQTAKVMNLPSDTNGLIENLIESCLWDDEGVETEDDFE